MVTSANILSVLNRAVGELDDERLEIPIDWNVPTGCKFDQTGLSADVFLYYLAWLGIHGTGIPCLKAHVVHTSEDKNVTTTLLDIKFTLPPDFFPSDTFLCLQDLSRFTIEDILHSIAVNMTKSLRLEIGAGDEEGVYLYREDDPVPLVGEYDPAKLNALFGIKTT